MGDSNKEICRLCLEITPSCECRTIEEIRKEILEVLPINISLDISDYAVVCNRCLEILHNCFDFKSHCINTFMDVDIKVDIKKEIFQCELINHESLSQENSQVCRFCMSLFDVVPLSCTADWKYEIPLKDVVRNCLPDLDLDAVHESLICKQCLNSITRYYEFLKNCQEVEQRIKRFCQVRGLCTIGKINLKDVLTFKNCDLPINSTIVKKECPDVECDDMKRLKSDEIVNIKCEEVDIKDELDNGVETDVFDQSGDYDNSGNFLKREIRNIESKGKMHLCPKCPYSAKTNSRMKRHMRSHSPSKVHKCTLCSFVADTMFSYRAHFATHKGPTKAFGCRVCPFETDYKNSLEQHLLKHKDKSKVEMQKCSLCPFESKYKTTLLTHRKLEHGKDIKMYNCETCSFSSKYKVSLVNHQFLHKNPEEIPKLKCEKCEFQTRYKRYWVKHMLTHGDLETVRKFKYPYRYQRQQNPSEHVKIDSNNSLFSCDECTYSSNFKKNLQNHKRTHQKYKNSPQIHMKLQAPVKPLMFKCDKCEYSTRRKSSLKRHKVKHMELGETVAYKCALCDFQSKYKQGLKCHLKSCLRKKKNENKKTID